MVLTETSTLLANLYWITLLAVVLSSASGVLKAGSKQFDLFGVIIIAVATGLGGGSLRDMLLDIPVFWIQDQVFFIASVVSALAIFFTARLLKIASKHFSNSRCGRSGCLWYCWNIGCSDDWNSTINR